MFSVPCTVVSFIHYVTGENFNKMVVTCFHHFGHSFPARLLDHIRSQEKSIPEMIPLPSSSRMFIDGYSGLTYNKVLMDPDRYLRKLRIARDHGGVDVLSVDLGTNDLCSPTVTVSVLVQTVLDFIKLIEQEGLRPKYLVFFSVLQRSVITRRNQVSVRCFNHKAKKFNKRLSDALATSYPWASVFAQDRVNLPKYLQDGCHLTPSGMAIYSNSLSRMCHKYKAFLSVQ